MTSSAHVSSRLNPGEPFQSPLEPLVHCHAKGELDIESRSCSLLTICRSGVMFPWMNPRTTDSEQSGNSGFVYYLSNNPTFYSYKILLTQSSLSALMGWIHTSIFNEHLPHVCTEYSTQTLVSDLCSWSWSSCCMKTLNAYAATEISKFLNRAKSLTWQTMSPATFIKRKSPN